MPGVRFSAEQRAKAVRLVTEAKAAAAFFGAELDRPQQRW
jgi:hypothetical protein